MFSEKIRGKSNGLKRNRGNLSVLLTALMVLILGLAGPVAWANDDDDEEIPFDEANIFFELNDTDGDLGIHALIDGEPWKKLQIEDPEERKMLKINVKGRLRKQGLTELFFESAEPTFDELPPEQFFSRFPEGIYEIEGLTLDGYELESEAELTHLLPAPPDSIKVSGKTAAEDCDVVSLPEVSEPVIISWDPVTLSHPDLGRTNEPIEVVQYQLVVEQVGDGDDFTLSFEVPPDITKVEIPASLIPEGDAKFEILVREDSGNQTAVESCFVVK